MTNMIRCALIAGTAIGISSPVLAGEPAAASGDLARAYAAELMADAEERTSMLAQQDRRFTANVNGQLKFRYVFNNASDRPGDDDTTVGFQARRTKINVHGNVIDENWSYAILTAFSRSTGTPTLENAFVQRRFEGGWYAKLGQFKLPFLREENVSSTRQLAADRSNMNNFFTQGYSQGLEIGFGGSGEDLFRIAGAFSDGLGSRNTDINSTPADYALTARGEVRLAGNWRQFREFTSFQGREFGALLGGAVHWESGGSTFGTIDRDILSATADVSVVGNGWHVYGAGVWRQIDAAGAKLDDFGLVAQGGFFVTENTEFFGRWDAIFADGDRAVGDFHTLTVGLNYYITPESHAAKFTLDLQYLLDAPADSLTPSASAGRGVGLMFDDIDSGQWAVRAQMQILF